MSGDRETRPALRTLLRERRRAWTEQRSPADLALAFSVLPSPLRALVAGVNSIGGYCAVGSEADPHRLLERIAIAAPHGLTALPAHTARDAPMQFRRWIPGEALAPGPWHIPQPLADQPTLLPGLLLVPLLGFDRRGTRLGQGGGHYDRYLAAHPGTIAVGVAWSVQEVDHISARPHDQPLHAILTEREWIIPS